MNTASMLSLAIVAFVGCTKATPSPPGAQVAPPAGATVTLPSGAPGIGFDDLRFSAGLGKVLVPAGRSGRLDLVDAASGAVTAVEGFSAEASYGGGHDFGATSADFGGGLIYVTDRTTKRIHVVDPASKSIVGSAALSAGPDYVRYVATTAEVWVTEPDAEQIEVFTLAGGGRTPVRAAAIATKGGPESLVTDLTRRRAYTHLWDGATVALDVAARGIVATWPNGCKGSRGIELDEARGFLLVGCAEGKAVVLDVNGGKQLGTLERGSGVDVIAYNPALGHLYLPGAKSGTMATLGVSATGALTLLGEVTTASGAHCVAADDKGDVLVCDPAHGQLLKYVDTHPASR
jgi:DNA-binding beta-propeller fold protein YncE